MGNQTWEKDFVGQVSAGALLNTYTTAKSVINPQSVLWLPAGFWFVGREIKVTFVAGVSNRVTGPDTFTVQMMIGPAIPVTIIAFTSGAINLTTTAHTTIPMVCEIWLKCTAVGSGTGATLVGQARFMGQMVAMAASLADGAANTGWAMGPNTAPANGTGFDSTIGNYLDCFVAQSFSGAGNGIQISDYRVNIEN